MDLYRDLLTKSWDVSGHVMTDIPVSKAQLMGRVGDYDGGQTSKWMVSLKEPTWRAVRDAHTGHSIHCVSDRPFNKLTKDLLLSLRLLAWMSVRTPVTFFWWDQPWTRMLPADVDPRKEHLNGGWAIPGVPEVHVYRREEVHKVLIHETIHAIQLDVPHHLVDPVRMQFEDLLGRRLWPHLGEAFTELFAEWLWSIASNKRWENQVKCSEGQAAAIWCRIRDATDDEDTSVFAYYILKWVLMLHMDEVVLAPNHSVKKWVVWWKEALPTLNQMATEAAASENKPMRMGMTCNKQ